MKYIRLVFLSLLLASCTSKVAFVTDATVQSTDVGILRQQDYLLIGFKPDAYFEYRGPLKYIPVGRGLRGSEESFSFRHEARRCEHEVSFAYLSAAGMKCRTARFVPAQVEEVIFSRERGILLRPHGGGALVQPHNEERMCTD